MTYCYFSHSNIHFWHYIYISWNKSVKSVELSGITQKVLFFPNIMIQIFMWFFPKFTNHANKWLYNIASFRRPLKLKSQQPYLRITRTALWCSLHPKILNARFCCRLQNLCEGVLDFLLITCKNSDKNNYTLIWNTIALVFFVRTYN